MKLTKTALRKFITWTTSRYNEMSKSQAVDYAYDVLAGGRAIDGEFSVFSCGSYTPSSAMTHGGDYWVVPAEKYIAKGIAHWDYVKREYTLVEKERIDFE